MNASSRLRRAIRLSPFANDVSDILTMLYLSTVGGRKDDSFLCSFAKSGRTWLRFMLSHYQVNLLNLPLRLHMANFTTISPNVIMTSNMGLMNSPKCPQGAVRILGTHSDLTFLFKSRKIIFLSRRIKDTLISQYHHLKANGDFEGPFDQFMRSPHGLEKIMRYYRRWTRLVGESKGEVLHIPYDKLKDETQASLVESLNFLGLKVTPELVAKTIEYGSRENMRSLEKAFGTYDQGWGVAYENRRANKVQLAPEAVEPWTEAISRSVEDESRRSEHFNSFKAYLV